MAERFVSEAIEPDIAGLDTARMATGEPGLPRRFVWRGQAYTVASVRRSWKDTGPCRHGSGERYVRKHWTELETTSGIIMKVYFERGPRSGSKGPRWWLFSIDEDEGEATEQTQDR